RELEITVQREQDHEDQEQRERPDDLHLVFGFEEFAVLAAPRQPVALRQRFLNVGDRALAVRDGSLKVASLDAVLHADVPGIVFAIDERRTTLLADVRELAQRNLLACRSADEQAADLLSVLAELRFHAHDQVEQLFAL